MASAPMLIEPTPMPFPAFSHPFPAQRVTPSPSLLPRFFLSLFIYLNQLVMFVDQFLYISTWIYCLELEYVVAGVVVASEKAGLGAGGSG